MTNALYATVDDLAEFIGTDQNFDLLELDVPLEAACRMVDAHCRDRFYLDTDPDGLAVLSERVFFPLSSDRTIINYAAVVSQVALDLDGDNTFETAWATTDWYTTPLNGIASNGDFNWPAMSIQAAGTKWFQGNGMNRPPVQVRAAWGWGNVPTSVKMATLITAKDLWTTKDERGGLVSFGDIVAVARRNPTVLTLLAPYRRRRLLVA